MRITDKYEKRGQFWFDDNRNKKFQGTLFIENGGLATLKLENSGLATLKLENSAFPQKDRILGNLNEGDSVLLEKCVEIGVRIRNEFNIRQYRVGRVFETFVFDPKCKNIKINSFTFSVDGLNHWIEKTGISTENGENRNEKIYRCKSLDSVDYKLKNDMAISFSFHLSFSSDHSKEITIKEEKKITLQSSEPKDIDDFIGIANKIVLFLCFVMDETVCIKNIQLKSDEFPGEKGSLFYESRPFKTKINKFYYPILLYFCEIEDFETTINKWLEILDLTKPALYLYLLSKAQNKRFAEDKFSNLMQVSEAYCQRFHKNAGEKFEKIMEKMFKGKIEKYCSDQKKFTDIFKKIRDTRNYVIHYNPDKEFASMKGNDIYCINEFVEGLIQIRILEDLGIDSSIIKKICNNNYKTLKRRLDRLTFISFSKYNDSNGK